MHRRALRASVILASFLASTPTVAQDEQLCVNALDQDRQPEFSPYNLELSGVALTYAHPPQLQLNTANPRPVDPEHLVFTADQQLSVSFVSEHSDASHALGWLYYDELIQRGYIHPGDWWDASDDVLLDGNGNGIADLHEDLFNLAPPGGPQARPYVGTMRRCSTTFTHNGFVYSEPALAIRGCGPSYARSYFEDARPNGTSMYLAASTGMIGGTTAAASDYSDHGLYPRVPNLLEPTHAANGNLGLGNLLFLLADDDYDTRTYRTLAPVQDRAATEDGLPDYPASQYDGRGLLRANGNPSAPITAADRTVQAGVVQAHRELVFFLITYRDSGSSGVHPCLRYDGMGRCELYLKTPVSVFFSKSLLNLDQNPTANDPVVERDMKYDRYTCSYETPYCGWLEPETLERLSALPNSLSLPAEPVSASRPANGRMPHALLGQPSTAPTRWVLAFEDEHGGGDLDFNDVVFLVERTPIGTVRSAIVSGDISPDVRQEFAVTRVAFAKWDIPFSEALPGACGLGTPPRIDYAIATDCALCDGMACWSNPNPTWVSVPLAPGTAGTELDLTQHTPAGASLCWKATMTSPHVACLPRILNVDIGYQAARLGAYCGTSGATSGDTPTER